MNLVIIILDILFLIAIGYFIGDILLYHKSYTFLKKLSLSYALGFGFVGFQLFFLFVSGVKWNLVIILLPWILLFIAYIIKQKKTLNKFNLKNNFKKIKVTGNFTKILIIAIFSLILFVGIESVLRPVQAWDGWDNWLLRSSVFFTKNGIDPYYFKYTGDEYPLIIPLTTTFGYFTIGKIDDSAVLLFYFMFYLSLGGIFYAEARRFFKSELALLCTFLLLSTQNLIRHGGRYEAGQADLAVGFYIFIGSVLLFDYLKLKSKKSLLLLCLILGITAQIKNDALPFVLFAFTIALFSTLKYKKYANLILFLPLVFPLLSWNFFKRFNHIHGNYLFTDGINIQINRIPDVFLAMSKEFINFQNWNLLWLVFIFSLLIFRKNFKKNWLFICIVLFQWFSYFFVFLITPIDPVIHISNVINKLYLHIAPLAVLITGLLLTPTLRNSSFFKKLKN